jgi:hypothetical protein
VIGPPDPAAQLLICAGMSKPSDAESCVRGTKVQNLLEYPTSAHVDLISRCAVFTGAPRAACFRWLGKTLAVLTDWEVRPHGLPPASLGARAVPSRGAAHERRARDLQLTSAEALINRRPRR